MKWTNKYNIPERIWKQAGTLYQPKPYRLSVTQLISCPRERTLLLERWDDIVLDRSDFLQTIIGIGVHNRQDKLFMHDDDIESEEKMEVKVGDWTIVGRSDNREDTTIRESKTKSVTALTHESFINDVTNQLNSYSWINRKLGRTINKLELDIFYRDWVGWKAKQNKIRYAVMKEGRKTALKLFDSLQEAGAWMEKNARLGEHLYTEERGPKDYPDLCVEWSIPIELWSFEKQEEYVMDQIHLFDMAPDYCDERCSWKDQLKCKEYCSARSVCNKELS